MIEQACSLYPVPYSVQCLAEHAWRNNLAPEIIMLYSPGRACSKDCGVLARLGTILGRRATTLRDPWVRATQRQAHQHMPLASQHGDTRQ